MANVYISHIHADAEFVSKLANDLRHCGLTVWFADQKVELGFDQKQIIEDAIVDADNVLVVLSEHAASSTTILTDTAIAITQGRQHIVPIYATKDPDIPFILKKIPGVNLSDSKTYETSLNSLVSSLSQEEPRDASVKFDDTSVRLLRARLESIIIEEEREYLERTEELKTRTQLVIAVAATFSTALAGMILLFVFLSEHLETPPSGLIGGIVGAIVGMFTSILFRLLRNRKPHK